MRTPVLSGDIIVDPEAIERWQKMREAQEQKEKEEQEQKEKEKQEKAEKEKQKKTKKKTAKKKKTKSKQQESTTKNNELKTVPVVKKAPAKTAQQTTTTIEVPATDNQKSSMSPMGVTTTTLLLGVCITFVYKLRSQNKR